MQSLSASPKKTPFALLSLRPRLAAKCVLSALGAVAVAFLSQPASAQSTISRSGARFPYGFEAEPHLLLGPFGPPGTGWGGDGFGLGFRGTVELASEGFIAKVNDSVGIGFGLDWLHFGNIDARGGCTDWETGPNNTRVCVEVNGGADRDVVVVPIVMQWNFWLTRKWSVFGEPGLFFYGGDGDGLGIRPLALYVGGRYHFSDTVALTARLGYPTLSIGASFFF